jgi:dienelactone hydrolase
LYRRDASCIIHRTKSDAKESLAMIRHLVPLMLGLALFAPRAGAADPPPLDEYFRIEVAKIAAKPLLGITTAAEWKDARPGLQRKMIEMLGLDPNELTTRRYPLRVPVITGKVERPDFIIEKILYESRPGLLVTANLYRPKVVDKPLPAILYVCGHSRNEKDGIIYGCKAHYQHHAEWYAANGYVCLVLDTLQLGELPGLHHGTFRYGLWWWSALGYTPAGVEALSAVRGIDYLLTRPEVDRSKIGVTGRSGGGATSWWVGAIDDRVSVVIPVAGITDLKNHVVDGVVEGHCDCMYPVNTERWDFDTIAALVAPKALLVENTDKDPIFPEDGVRRIYAQLEKVYAWYGAEKKLGLVIGKGAHLDTEEIRHPSFAFMDKWLKRVDRPIVEPDRTVPMELLAVLDGNRPPENCQNAVIHETFRKPADPFMTDRLGLFTGQTNAWRDQLTARVFAGWPTSAQAGRLGAKPVTDVTRGPIRIRGFDFQSQPGINLRLWSMDRAGNSDEPKAVRIEVIDPASWLSTWSPILGPPEKSTPISVGDGWPAWVEARTRVLSGERVILIAPRGVGPTAWPVEKDKNVRRRFLLLGQTLDGMRAWDVYRGIAAAREIMLAPDRRPSPPDSLVFAARGEATTWLLWAIVQGEPTRGVVELTSPPPTIRESPAYLNLASILDMPEALTLLYPAQVRLRGTTRGPWARTFILEAVFAKPGWLTIE